MGIGSGTRARRTHVATTDRLEPGAGVRTGVRDWHRQPRQWASRGVAHLRGPRRSGTLAGAAALGQAATGAATAHTSATLGSAHGSGRAGGGTRGAGARHRHRVGGGRHALLPRLGPAQLAHSARLCAHRVDCLAYAGAGETVAAARRERTTPDAAWRAAAWQRDCPLARAAGDRARG